MWNEIGSRSEQLDTVENEVSSDRLDRGQAPDDTSIAGYLLNENLSEPFVGMPKLMLDFDANPKRQTEIKDMAWGSSLYFLLVLRHFQKKTSSGSTQQLKRWARQSSGSLFQQFKSKVNELEALHKDKGYPLSKTEVRERLVLTNQKSEHVFCDQAVLRDHLLSLPQELFKQALLLFWSWLLALERSESFKNNPQHEARVPLQTTELCTALEKLVRWYVFLLGRQALLESTESVGIAISLDVQAAFWNSTARELDMSWSEVVNSKFAAAVYASELLPGSKLYFRMLYGDTSLRLHQAVVAQKTLAKAEFMALQQIGRTKNLQALWKWNHQELSLPFSAVGGEKKGDEAAISAQSKDMQDIHFRKIGCADLLDLALIAKSFEDLLDHDAVPSVFCLPFNEMAQHTQTGGKRTSTYKEKTFMYTHCILRVTGGWMVTPSVYNQPLPFRPVASLRRKKHSSVFSVRLVEAFVVWLSLTEKADTALFGRLREIVGVSGVSRFLTPLRDALEKRVVGGENAHFNEGLD